MNIYFQIKKIFAKVTYGRGRRTFIGGVMVIVIAS
jgi:hypothetical protein